MKNHEELFEAYMKMTADEQAKFIIKISKEMESIAAEERFNLHISIEPIDNYDTVITKIDNSTHEK